MHARLYDLLVSLFVCLIILGRSSSNEYCSLYALIQFQEHNPKSFQRLGFKMCCMLDLRVAFFLHYNSALQFVVCILVVTWKFKEYDDDCSQIRRRKAANERSS